VPLLWLDIWPAPVLLRHIPFQLVLLRLGSLFFSNTVFAPSAFALLRPSMRPSYSVMLFVDLNSSLVAYFVRRPDGAMKMAEALAPKCPHAPSV
jgi:hypothetical protein